MTEHSYSNLTALFNNTRTLKFKTQPTVPFFAAENIIADVSENNDALRKIIKSSCLWLVIGGFRFNSLVPVFRSAIFVAIIMIDRSVQRKP